MSESRRTERIGMLAVALTAVSLVVTSRTEPAPEEEPQVPGVPAADPWEG